MQSIQKCGGAIYYKISCSNDNLLATGFLCGKEPTNEVDKDVVAVVRTNSQCKEEVVGDVQNKFP